MRGFCRTRPQRLPLLLAAVVAALITALTGIAPAEAADARLEDAQQRRAAVQQRLGEVLGRLDRLQAETAQIEDRVAELEAEAAKQRKAARSADRLLEARLTDAYKRGQVSLALTMFSSEGAAEAQERARLLVVLASRDRATSESATSAQVRALATAEQVGAAVAELEAKQAELAAARQEVEAALADARAEEAEVVRTIAAEEQAAAERAARQRATRDRASSSSAPSAASAPSSSSGGGGGGGGGAPVSGGIACPVGTPRSYSDTYGAPRSGGRSHEGTDILAPRGTPSYAYEAGTVTRMDGNSLGGISLYLRGNSGNTYYYTHLNGYAAGVNPGDSVSAGQLIAYVGDTGNAAGIPHLHFEVWPGGGGGVNPYPYVLRACG